jgi:hypothetical protein
MARRGQIHGEIGRLATGQMLELFVQGRHA